LRQFGLVRLCQFNTIYNNIYIGSGFGSVLITKSFVYSECIVHRETPPAAVCSQQSAGRGLLRHGPTCQQLFTLNSRHLWNIWEQVPLDGLVCAELHSRLFQQQQQVYRRRYERRRSPKPKMYDLWNTGICPAAEILRKTAYSRKISVKSAELWPKKTIFNMAVVRH